MNYQFRDGQFFSSMQSISRNQDETKYYVAVLLIQVKPDEEPRHRNRFVYARPRQRSNRLFASPNLADPSVPSRVSHTMRRPESRSISFHRG